MAKVNFGKTKQDEEDRRTYLKVNLPRVYEKVSQFKEKLERGESIGIIQFQYDFQCNFRCEHCSIEPFKMTKTQERHQGRRVFTLDDVRNLSEQADKMGLANFVITGGEPLLFSDFDDLVKAIDPKKFFIVSDSNGWFLDEERARHLKSIGVQKIQLSLDGLDAAQHDAFRNKPGSHARVMRAIDACKKADLHVILSTVVWKSRVRSKEFIDFLEFAKSKEVGTYVTFAKPVGAYSGRYDVMVSPADTKYIQELEKKYDVFTHLTPSYGLDMGCIAVKRMIPITRYGDILPCPYTHVSLGNFFEEPLNDIISRALKIKWFDPTKKMPCLCGVSKKFVDEVVSKTWDRPLPVKYDEIFNDKDWLT